MSQTNWSHASNTKILNLQNEELPFKNAYILVLVLLAIFYVNEAQKCHPSGMIRGKKSPSGHCTQEQDPDCCIPGKMYPTYTCSPPVSKTTHGYLTLASFETGGDKSLPTKCDNKYHSDNEPIVALSTGWYNDGGRCHEKIRISGNGRSVLAMVVDECDSTRGCDAEHEYMPPCGNNLVVASKAVWEGLGVSRENWGGLDITWTDA